MNQKLTLIAGATLGLLGVALGAFGAHALKNSLTQNGRLETFELAVRYQFYHAFALLVTGLLMQKFVANHLQWASLLFLLGTLLFSGSLYLYALTNKTGFAMITPLGGLLLLGGWAVMLYAMVSK
ncbi:MAG: DUF423 domain-containing protein [Bacteroidetes bacterium]|nr:DUF423 domain-containing protein [Bacteroidota bacterium]